MDDAQRMGLDRNTVEGAGVDFARALSADAGRHAGLIVFAFLGLPVLLVGGLILLGTLLG